MKTIAPIDAPPVRRLAAEPVIASLDDLATALEECSWLESRANTVYAACEQAIRLVKADAERELVVDVDGVPTAIAARLKTLKAAILDWADANREIVLADTDTKTARFSHGELAWKASPLRIDFAEGKTEKDVIRAADKHAPADGGWLAWICSRLKREKITGTLNAAELFGVKLTLNKSVLLAKVKSGELTAKDLRGLHLRVVDNEEKLGVKVAEYHVTGEAA